MLCAAGPKLPQRPGSTKSFAATPWTVRAFNCVVWVAFEIGGYRTEVDRP